MLDGSGRDVRGMVCGILGRTAPGSNDHEPPSADASPLGLTSAEAEQRRRVDGANVLPAPRRPSSLRRLVAELVHFFAVMLWVAAVLAWIAGLPALGIAIAVVIVINGLFAFVQESRADRAAERLRGMLPARVGVRRDALATPCRHRWRPRLLLASVPIELAIALTVLLVPWAADRLDHAPPPMWGWLVASASAAVLLGVDALDKRHRNRSRGGHGR